MPKAQILEFDRRIMAWPRSNEMSQRLDAVGPALATALVALMRRDRKTDRCHDRLNSCFRMDELGC